MPTTTSARRPRPTARRSANAPTAPGVRKSRKNSPRAATAVRCPATASARRWWPARTSPAGTFSSTTPLRTVPGAPARTAWIPTLPPRLPSYGSPRAATRPTGRWRTLPACATSTMPAISETAGPRPTACHSRLPRTRFIPWSPGAGSTLPPRAFSVLEDTTYTSANASPTGAGESPGTWASPTRLPTTTSSS